MLNVSAKEFVPTASPRCAAVVAAPPAVEPVSAASPAGSAKSDDGNRVSGGEGSAGGAKQLLSVKAVAFVPRTAVTNPDATTPEGPRGGLTQRSDSTVSSSIVSRDADCDGDEQPEPSATAARGGGGGGTVEEADCEGEELPAAEGGELSPEETGAYDAYNYGAYDHYGMPYIGACGDGLGSTVYYDAAFTVPYDAYQQPYYWDATAGAYVYGVQYGGEYDAWGQGGGSDGLQHPDHTGATLAGGRAAGVSATDSELRLDVDGQGGASLRDLTPSDAAELLELFFPHYAGEALSRLLERAGGDLTAAFSELAAMERQVGAERAATAAAAGASGRPLAGAAGAAGRSGGGRGGTGRGPAARQAGPGGAGKRSGGGAAFKLDLEAFPSLAPSGSPQRAKVKDEDPVAADGEQEGTREEEEEGSQAAPATPASATPAPAPAVASPAKPNFAALLRNSTASPGPDAGQQQQLQPQQNSAAAAASSSNSPSRTGGAKAPKAAAGPGPGSPPVANSGAKGRGGAGGGGSGAVPWVATGEAVSSQYAEERQEAAMLARARNQYFQQATLAFLAGNKALARQLGRKGREANEAMKAAHVAAARRIFVQRNGGQQAAARYPQAAGAKVEQGASPQSRRQAKQQQQQQQHTANGGSKSQAAAGAGSGAGSGQQDVLFVDLHGLHAAEAVSVLEAQIEEARTAGYRYLRVCTGTGHHTKGAKTPARLPTAVTETLLSNHLTFKTLQPGLLEAQL